jgi:hypothetical protein
MSYPGFAQIRVGEWNANLCMSAFTNIRGRSLWIQVIRPDQSTFIRPAKMGLGNFWRADQVLEEGQWAYILIEDGDLTMEGIYVANLTADPNPPIVEITQAQFNVGT